ncbi:RHS repeat-associated core domain-containing protein [Oceanirhabdus sp. W0125-5]|uniref:RHS repeat-associated core domain-containing protein n=1 Tax=Oceanirhabdus sp. W0125-5 TaxID=2999116 RepID=UPI0022F2BDBB|nr:RHS repeat-associated core domain-containing protein [Oceanirhabdus sp. W0125-5]WBW97429.1 hypothetical protein OW730_00815 [Oceanirhabdus sp. W0125-5]
MEQIIYIYTYSLGGKLVSMNLNGIEYFYIRNTQGDIIGLIDETGVEVVKYTYDSWGKLISIKDKDDNDVTNDKTDVGYKNPYRYRGYRYDTETGLYYLQSRYYNPEWGRFINGDVKFEGNLFIYCDNNPINKYDPSGHIPVWLATSLISGAIGAVVSAGITAAQGLVTGNFSMKEVLISGATGFVSGALMPFLGATRIGAGILGATTSIVGTIWSKGTENVTKRDVAQSVLSGVAASVIAGPSPKSPKVSRGFGVGGIISKDIHLLNKSYAVKKFTKAITTTEALTRGAVASPLGNIIGPKLYVGGYKLFEFGKDILSNKTKLPLNPGKYDLFDMGFSIS